jgi:membrane-bound ClpP family serine protease
MNYPGFEFNPCQVNDSSQSNQGTDHLVSHIVSQSDVIKYMLQKPILSGRLGKWAYALVEYDLEFKPLKAMKGQVVADFIVEHNIE